MERPTDAAARRAEYLDGIDRRILWSDRAMNARGLGQIIAWTVALLAGAGVAVAEVLVDQWRWAPALLGFVVVVAQGADRLFARRREGAASMDLMRRALTKEKRLYLAGSGAYADDEAAFDAFVERAEAILDDYDSNAVAHV